VLHNLKGVLTLILHRCENRPLHHDAARRGPPPSAGIPPVLADPRSLEARSARSGEDL
jgi:hypothetical protein